MFILRKISGQGVEINITLGQSYTFIGKIENPQEFNRTLSEIFKQSNEEITYAFVSNEDGKMIPLYSTQKNYIMTESGKTFKNVSL